ncbi:TPA: hypothetical protein IAD52_09860 [Candidatus Spyradomonas excrementavium]|nr:hypothetical protein [Candidatus Spyradomonas excrementavium]
MKKFLYIFLSMLLFAGVCMASVQPTYVSTVPKNVYGFLQVEKNFGIYDKPEEKAQLLDYMSWDNEKVDLNNHKLYPAQVFSVFVPKKNYAFCYVMDEENGFYKIVYDKKNGLTGWVKPEKSENFWTLKDFYTYFGKKTSLYYLKDVDIHTRNLRSAPSDTAQSIGGFNVAKNIKLVLIKGNWALVSVIDYEGTVPKTGFVKWRDADGSVLLFPKMD